MKYLVVLLLIVSGCATRPQFVDWQYDDFLKVRVGERYYVNEQAKSHGCIMGTFGVNGFYAPFEGRIYCIYDSIWSSSTQPRLETLGHEFGHVLYGTEFYQ